MGRYFRHAPEHQSKTGKIIGAGLVGLALGALAGIFFSPKSGSENREDLANWMDDFKREVNRKTREARGLTEDKYDEIVDSVSDKYRKLKDIKENELDDFVEDLKERWDRIKDQWNE